MIILMLTIAPSYIFSQTNSVVIPISDVDLAYQKLIELDYYRELADSLEAEIYKRDAIILLYENKDATSERINELTVQKYTLLLKDYDKLKKGNLLNGVIGGEVGANYQKVLNNPYITLNLGLMFKRKYIFTAKCGFNLDKEIVLGFSGLMVF